MARPRHLPLYSPPSHSPLHVYFLVYLLSNLLVLYPVCTPWLATKLLTSCNYVNIFFSCRDHALSTKSWEMLRIQSGTPPRTDFNARWPVYKMTRWRDPLINHQVCHCKTDTWPVSPLSKYERSIECPVGSPSLGITLPLPLYSMRL